MNFETDIYIKSEERIRLTRNFNSQTQQALGLQNKIHDMVLLEPRSSGYLPRKTLVIALDELSEEVCLMLEGICQRSHFIKSSRRENHSLYEDQLYFDQHNSPRFIFVGKYNEITALQKNKRFVEWSKNQVRVWYFASFNLKEDLIYEAKDRNTNMFVYAFHNPTEEVLMAPDALAGLIFQLSNILYPTSIFTDDIDIDGVFFSGCKPGFMIHQRVDVGKSVEDLISLTKAQMRLHMEAGVITEAPLEGLLIALAIPDTTLERWTDFEQQLYEAFASKKTEFHCAMPAQIIQKHAFINLWIWGL